MRRRWMSLCLGLAAALVLAGAAASLAKQEVPRISPAELKEKLGDPQVVVLDLRSPHDWAASQEKIAGAVRENPRALDWAGKYPKDKTLVLYCA